MLLRSCLALACFVLENKVVPSEGGAEIIRDLCKQASVYLVIILTAVQSQDECEAYCT